MVFSRKLDRTLGLRYDLGNSPLPVIARRLETYPHVNTRIPTKQSHVPFHPKSPFGLLPGIYVERIAVLEKAMGLRLNEVTPSDHPVYNEKRGYSSEPKKRK